MKLNSKIKIVTLLLIMLSGSCELVPGLLSSSSKSGMDVSKPSGSPASTPSGNTTSSKPTPTPTPSADTEKAQSQEMQNNIKTFAGVLEIYAEEYGYYPENVDKVFLDASKNAYWKEFKNPYTEAKGIGIKGSFIDMKEYKYYTTQSSLKGLVVYEPQKCKDTTDICNYKLYGTDKTGALVQKQ